MKYTYYFSVEQENTPSSSDVLCENQTIDFFIESHDDAFSIIEELRKHGFFDDTTCASFVFGLKSLGFAMINNKNPAFVKKLMPHFTTLMKEIKEELSRAKSKL